MAQKKTDLQYESRKKKIECHLVQPQLRTCPNEQIKLVVTLSMSTDDQSTRSIDMGLTNTF